MAIEIDMSGRFYCSISAAAKDLGMSPTLLRKYIAMGKPLDPITIVPKRKGHSTKPIPVVINGKAFMSIAEAARYYNVTYRTLYLAIKQAMDGEKTLFASDTNRVFRPGRQITIDNVTYTSWTEAACKLGICYHTFVDRVKTGYYDRGGKPREDGRGTSVCVNGVRYRSMKECAIANNLEPWQLSARVRMGFSLEVSIDPEKYAIAKEKWDNEREQERIARRDKKRAARELERKEEKERRKAEAAAAKDAVVTDFVKQSAIITDAVAFGNTKITETIDW